MKTRCLSVPAETSREGSLRFRGGAARHIVAMELLPGCRALELAPLRYILPRGRGRLLDLFAGTGFVSAALGRSFRQVTAIDASISPTGASRDEIESHLGDATSSAGVQSWPMADLAVCHAGFHHVLGAGGTTDANACRARRLEVLRLWSSRVASGGRLVIADVPSHGTENSYTCGPAFEADEAIVHARQDEPWQGVGHDSRFAETLQTSSLNAYLRSVTSLCAAYDLMEAEPALFFDRFVDEHSPYGHVARFSTPQELSQLFLEAGFTDVTAFVAPTPWLFGSKEAACWFVHELLNIGRACSSSYVLQRENQSLVEDGLSEHLKLRVLPNGAWAVAWRLMYVTGVRK